MIELNAVFIGIAEIKGLADAVVGRAVEVNSCADETAQRITKRSPVGVADGEMEKAGRSRRRRGATFAFPGIESDMMMVAACADERGLGAHALRQLEAEDATIELKCAIEIRHLEVDVANIDPRIDGFYRGHTLS